MKISGFTIIKNAVLNDYPIVEAITSILSVVDEMVVLIGDCDDGTKELIQSINDTKIKIYHSVWDTKTYTHGTVLAVETNKAFALIDPESDWAFYIQGDEAVHEKYYTTIKNACELYKNDKTVEGLLFKYLHFYGSYNYVGDSRKWYNKEVRIIRNDKKIQSYKDAQGFRVVKRKLCVKEIDAFVYHYGWVRSPETILAKNIHLKDVWTNEAQTSQIVKLTAADLEHYFETFDSLEIFAGTHPNVWQQRIKNKNWEVNLDISKKQFSLKNKVLYYFEKFTGIRLFDFRNYKIIK